MFIEYFQFCGSNKWSGSNVYYFQKDKIDDSADQLGPHELTTTFRLLLTYE